MGALQVGIIQPEGDRFCREDGGAYMCLYLLSAYRRGAVCWTPLVALCSGIIFHPLCMLG